MGRARGEASEIKHTAPPPRFIVPLFQSCTSDEPRSAVLYLTRAVHHHAAVSVGEWGVGVGVGGGARAGCVRRAAPRRAARAAARGAHAEAHRARVRRSERSPENGPLWPACYGSLA